ncbi:MAG: hypothetical protein JO076_08005 [Verrucomicrobia bacterium]|nr:hypothetical protein [Verrucomicrobiota bacterium]
MARLPRSIEVNGDLAFLKIPASFVWLASLDCALRAGTADQEVDPASNARW